MLLWYGFFVQALLKFFHIHLLNHLTLSQPTQPGAIALQLILKEGNKCLHSPLSLPSDTQTIIVFTGCIQFLSPFTLTDTLPLGVRIP